MTTVSRKYPFTPQEGVALSEARLVAYLEICCRAKPSADKIDAWEESYRLAHKGHKTAFRGQAAGLVSAFMRDIESGMADQQMGPTEFAWIGDRLRTLTAPSLSPEESAEADWNLIARHSERIRDCALGDKAYGIVAGFATARRNTPSAT